jgi:hypothetical protein
MGRIITHTTADTTGDDGRRSAAIPLATLPWYVLAEQWAARAAETVACRSRAATELHNRPIDEAEMVTSSDGVWCAHERRVKEALAHKLDKFSSFASDCRVHSPTERRTR